MLLDSIFGLDKSFDFFVFAFLARMRYARFFCHPVKT